MTGTVAGYNNKDSSKSVHSSSSLEEATAEVSSRGRPALNKADKGLKKGPWTAAEDAILLDYIANYGEGNWNRVREKTGLPRCGKSCRLRWENHLRPDLVKGPFSPEEEAIVIRLHAKLGNKWAKMALEIPGRTDNDIKNYWNTRKKQRRRIGVPIYPSEVFQGVDGGLQRQDAAVGQAGAKHPSNLQGNQGLVSCPPNLCDLPSSSILSNEGVNLGVNLSRNLDFMYSHRRDNPFVSSIETTRNIFPPVELPGDDSYAKHVLDFLLCCSYETCMNSGDPSAMDFVPGSHASLNGNASSSEPVSAVLKSELPSFQHSASRFGNWETLSSRLTSPESVDTLMQTRSDWSSTGLLEDVVYESMLLKKSKNSSNPQVSSLENYEAKSAAYGDPNSLPSQCAGSALIECSPASESYWEEPRQSTEAMPGSTKWGGEDFSASGSGITPPS